MKNSQCSRSTASSSLSPKNKKSARDREKRKSHSAPSENNHVSHERRSPSKDSNGRQYAGISSESIGIYAEHLSEEIYTVISKDIHESGQICNILAEDINYKLRYIIHDALLKARLSGRNNISSKDIEETFENLQIEKVFGAPTSPNWQSLTDKDGIINSLYLDDTKVNLVNLAEEEIVYAQPGTINVYKKWYPEEISKPLKQYFMTLCQSVVSPDCKLRKAALKDISENSKIGPITEWFYHFGYFLLSKDITYDCLTLRALDLIDTLENSPIGSANVSEKQLKLLVRLILQRLLMSVTTEEVLRPMCSVLGTLCLRVPLRQFVIQKINQKINGISQDFSLSILMIVHYLGLEAITEIFLPNLEYFLGRIEQRRESDLVHTVLGIYNIICRAELIDPFMHKSFHETFGNILVVFWRPLYFLREATAKDERNFVQMQVQLIKTRRLVEYSSRKVSKKLSLNEVFELPVYNCKIKRILDESMSLCKYDKKETHITIGKTTLLLSVLKSSKNSTRSKCRDHTLLSYNL